MIFTILKKIKIKIKRERDTCRSEKLQQWLISAEREREREREIDVKYDNQNLTNFVGKLLGYVWLEVKKGKWKINERK